MFLFIRKQSTALISEKFVKTLHQRIVLHLSPQIRFASDGYAQGEKSQLETAPFSPSLPENKRTFLMPLRTNIFKVSVKYSLQILGVYSLLQKQYISLLAF